MLVKQTVSTDKIQRFPSIHTSEVKMLALCQDKCFVYNQEHAVLVFDVNKGTYLSTVKLRPETGLAGLISLDRTVLWFSETRLVKICAESHQFSDLGKLFRDSVLPESKIIGLVRKGSQVVMMFESSLVRKIHVVRLHKTAIQAGYSEPILSQQTVKSGSQTKQSTLGKAAINAASKKGKSILKINLLGKLQKPAKEKARQSKHSKLRKKHRKGRPPKSQKNTSGESGYWKRWAVDPNYSWNQANQAGSASRDLLDRQIVSQRSEIETLTKRLQDLGRENAKLKELMRAYKAHFEREKEQIAKRADKSCEMRVQQAEQSYKQKARKMVGLARSEIQKLAAQISEQSEHIRRSQSEATGLTACNQMLEQELRRLRANQGQSESSKKQSWMTTVEEHKTRVLAQEVRACMALLTDYQDTSR